MNGGVGPVSAPPSARAAAASGTAGDAAAADSGFPAALEDAQGPANATAPPSTAAKARAATRAAVPATPPREQAPVDASAAGTRAAPAETVGADADAPPDKSAAREHLTAPDLSLLLPGWPAAAALRASGLPDPATTETQDRVLRRSALVDPQHGQRGEMPQTGAGLRPAAALPSATAMAADAWVAPALRAAAETPTALPLPALHASFMPATAASVAATAAAAAPLTFEAKLAAALDSAAFTPALATQVSWLVREGVQHARLSLNPAEMGPVTVQISLDGTQARVDFSADLAATRAAIESSLPALAAALHESGLKLAGGGVFDGQPRPGTPGERGQSGARPGQPGNASEVRSDAPGAGRAPAVVQRGLVDLVA